MSAMLLCGDALLRLPSARVARDRVTVLRDSAQLLDEARRQRDDMAAQVEEANRQGYAAGREEALAEMRQTLSETLAALNSGFTEESRRRETAAATAAMHALERLIGARENSEVVTGLVREALRQSGAIGVRILVAPDMADPVRRALGSETETVVESDPALAPLACRILSGDGQVIADLDTQLSALRRRWGLVAEDGEVDA